MVELDEVADGVREHLNYPVSRLDRFNQFVLKNSTYIDMCHVKFLLTYLVLAVLPLVDLIEVAEGVLEHYDHLGNILNRFIFEE